MSNQKPVISTNYFSNTTLGELIMDQHELGAVVVISSMVCKNGAYQVTYLAVANGKRSKCSTFLSVHALLRKLVQRAIVASKSVEFKNDGTTTTGWQSNPVHCNCKSYGSPNGLRINDIKSCKHTIAYARTFFGVSSLVDYVALQKNWLEGVTDAAAMKAIIHSEAWTK
jgi:hypothetical protein